MAFAIANLKERESVANTVLYPEFSEQLKNFITGVGYYEDYFVYTLETMASKLSGTSHDELKTDEEELANIQEAFKTLVDTFCVSNEIKLAEFISQIVSF